MDFRMNLASYFNVIIISRVSHPELSNFPSMIVKICNFYKSIILIDNKCKYEVLGSFRISMVAKYIGDIGFFGIKDIKELPQYGC